MCDWGKWEWLCEGHYEIALTILLVIALALALVIMAALAFGKKKIDARDKALSELREKLSRSEISPDEFLEQCDKTAQRLGLPPTPAIWRS